MVKHDIDLASLYGELFSKSFNSSTRNIFKGSISSKCHHCGECGKPAKKTCFQDLHLAFCIAPVDNPKYPGELCGERFTVKSPTGCSTHHYSGSGGANLIFRRACRGLDFASSDGQTPEPEPEVQPEPEPAPEFDENGNEIIDLQPWEAYTVQSTYVDKANRAKTAKTKRLRKSKRLRPTKK